ncbi:MAG TPA: prepilin-type N-terminal cleavage/methylation domain-containing protein [Chthoniobacterales bacterium]|jgi:hypothetical protein
MRRRRDAFTLAELLVSIVVLLLIVVIVSRMINSAASVVTMGSKRMDSASQVRPVFERMAIDFAQMVKRPDVDYYVKSNLDPETGNDRIAFFCSADGYSTVASQSSLSLVAYRINSDPSSSSLNRMQRMGKGLVWNGASTSEKPILFGLQAIYNNWPSATDNTTFDADYELFGPQIFRFEYFYLLKTGLISDQPGANGMQDVSAIAVTVATVDRKSSGLLSSSQLTTLSGRLKDFDASEKNYDLTVSWQNTLNGLTDMPRTAINGVRIYQRYFYLAPTK